MQKEQVSEVLLKNNPEFDHHQRVYRIYDSEKLIGFIAIHSVKGKNPSSGGTRFAEYECEEDALKDVLRLSKHMTKKHDVIGLFYGGAKAVFIANRIPNKKDWLIEYAAFLNSLQGELITGTDAGLTDEDIQFMSAQTRYIGGSAASLSQYTAKGLILAMQCCLKEKLGKEDLRGITIAIQGVGNIGSRLVESLYPLAKKIYVSDIDASKTQSLKKKYPNIEVISPDKIHQQKVDIYSPCGYGQCITSQIIHELQCKMIVGAANNQLVDPQFAEILHEKGILYAPDFLVNSGGMIAATVEYETRRNPKEDQIMKIMQTIPRILTEIIKVSQKQKISLHQALVNKMEK